MDSPFDFFGEIYCINLDHRTDRWVHAQDEFQSMGILDLVQRFSAIKEDDGRLGIIKSNLSIVKMAKEKNLDSVFVFEDDVKFLHDRSILEALIELSQREWGLFYLGGNVTQEVHKISPYLISARGVYGVHAMAYHKRVYDQVIERYSTLVSVDKWEDILDVFLVQNIQSKFPCFLMHPLMATQMDSYSDIEKRFVNQHYIEDRFLENVK